MNVETPSVSPFKFLDAYTAQDTQFFFGRQVEQRRLIELIFSSRLVLVYGASGTGKSSLIQCGLAKTLSLSDYFPVVIRRRGDFNMALSNTLTGILGEADNQEPVDLVSTLARQALRPVYLLFDQFEELFISGTQDEQLALIQTFQRLYDANVPCKLLVSMREEYIARLNVFEDTLPQLFDFRLRVEAMSERNLEEVIICTFQAIDGVELVDPKRTAHAIIQNIQLGKALFQLPYLQVYLDRLWRIGRQKASEKGLDHISIDPELVATVGEIENVLETFFQEQKEVLLQTLQNDNQENSQSSIDKVLESFVTYEGTRREQTLVRLVAETGLAQPTVWRIVSSLEKARLLRDDEGTYELPHDCLALVIDKGRSLAQRRLNDVIRRLKDSFYEYTSNPYDDFILTPRRLVEIQEIEPSLREELARIMPAEDKKIWTYISQSETYHQRKQAEVLQAQQAKYRRKAVILVLSFLLILTGTVIYALKKGNEALSAKNELSEYKLNSTTIRAKAFYWAYDSDRLPPAQAVRLLEQSIINLNTAKLPIDTIISGRLARRFNERDSILFNQFDLIHDAKVTSAVFSSDGQKIVTSSWDSTAKVWDITGKLIRTLVNKNKINSVSFSQDGQFIVCTLTSGPSTYWKVQGSAKDSSPLAIFPHKDSINNSAFSPNGRLLVTSSKDGTAKVWKIDKTGSLLLTLPHSGPVKYAAFLPDSRRICTVTNDGAVNIWDLKGKALFSKEKLDYAAFSSDGNKFMTVENGEIIIYNTSGNQFDGRYTKVDKFKYANFSPGNNQLILVYKDYNVRVWNTGKGEKWSPMQHSGDVLSATFSPDTNWILTASKDNTAKLWNRTGVSAVLLHEDAVNTASFSPNGQWVVTASSDNTAKVWNVGLERKAKKHFTWQEALKSLGSNNKEVPPLLEKNKNKYGIMN